jgi:histidinol-phosphate aminotransferase
MPLPIRPAVRNSPDYPFAPIDAPIKLDQNESPEDFPGALKQQVLHELAHTPWHRYPDLNAEALSQAIGAFEHWPASGVVVTTGSNVLIALLIQLAALDGRVLTVKPNFALYGLDARLLGAALTEVPLHGDFSLDVPALLDALATHTPEAPGRGVLYLPRPHAPTGSMATLTELEALLRASANGSWLAVIDEAYCHFAGESAAELASRYPHAVILKTFSKAWGLAGLRMGYALASDEVARQLRKLVPPFALSVMQTVAAQVALANPGYMHERVAQTISERERVYEALQAQPQWQVYPSCGNFLLIRTPDAAKAFAHLLAAGVLVRRQDSHLGLQGCIRVTIGAPHENDTFIQAALQA